jgi:hypothetical protein
VDGATAARFAASDAEDTLAGVMGCLVVPPPPAAPATAASPSPGDDAGDAGGVPAGGAAGQLLGGFPVDLGLYQYSGRLQVLSEIQ